MESYDGIVEISFLYSAQFWEWDAFKNVPLGYSIFSHRIITNAIIYILQALLTYQEVTERNDTKQGVEIMFSNKNAQQFRATVVSTNHIYCLMLNAQVLYDWDTTET